MKRLAIILVVLFGTFFLRAQQQETLESEIKSTRFGVFGGPLFGFGKSADQQTFIAGGGGGIIINDFWIGRYRAGIAAPILQNENHHFKGFDYGGMWLGYAQNADKWIHPIYSVKFGNGQLRWAASENGTVITDQAYVVLPEVGAEVSVASFFRLTATVGYRHTFGIDEVRSHFSNKDFRSWEAGLMLKFGIF
ncbi:MAG: hypothetical protein AAF573_01465 [Bacteroidota bacterium]